MAKPTLLSSLLLLSVAACDLGSVSGAPGATSFGPSGGDGKEDDPTSIPDDLRAEGGFLDGHLAGDCAGVELSADAGDLSVGGGFDLYLGGELAEGTRSCDVVARYVVPAGHQLAYLGASLTGLLLGTGATATATFDARVGDATIHAEVSPRAGDGLELGFSEVTPTPACTDDVAIVAVSARLAIRSARGTASEANASSNGANLHVVVTPCP